MFSWLNQARNWKMVSYVVAGLLTSGSYMTTDDIPIEARRLYHQTYAHIAKTYLAEYLGCPLETLSSFIEVNR